MATNTAYDIDRFESAPRRERIRVIRTGDELRAAADRKFVKQLVALTVVVVVLAVYTVYSNMLLTKTKSMIEKKNSELVEIQSENVFLDYQIESMVSLKRAEEYAENELGLIKLSPAQIEYVNLENSNKIVAEDTESPQLNVSSFLSTVIQFFEN
ncbi:MAG: hypothetical protein J5744_06270 [Oscillospiraceae bacterium]|nr:hypothetical protein [Oscillospiraceae bacterium]